LHREITAKGELSKYISISGAFMIQYYNTRTEMTFKEPIINTEMDISKGWRYSHPLVFEQHTFAAILASAAILMILCLLDYVTGYEFGFFIFYFIPVAMAAWYGGRKEGIAMALMCGICWYIADRLTHHPYSHAYFIYWETFMRLLSFLTTSLTISRIRMLVLNEEQLLTQLLSAQDELNRYRQSNISVKEHPHSGGKIQ
jgi:K+-sensing histidine kinase KdpD